MRSGAPTTRATRKGARADAPADPVSFSVAFYLLDMWLVAGCVIAALFVASELGWRLGHRRRHEGESLRSLVAGVAGATLAMLGLLLGFSLSMAISRYDARRAVIVDEANAIGTLWLRSSLLEDPVRSELRDAVRAYTDARVALYDASGDVDAVRAATARAEALHGAIWSSVERATRTPASPAILSSLITAANEVIDLHELRLSSIENFVPSPVILLLIGVAMIAMGFLGWSFGAADRRSTIAMLVMSVLVTAVIFVIMDLNRPQRGLIRVGHESILRVQQSIAEGL